MLHNILSISREQEDNIKRPKNELRGDEDAMIGGTMVLVNSTKEHDKGRDIQ